MIERETVIDQIQIDRTGHMNLRFGLLLKEDGNEIDCKWHRTTVPPDGDVQAQIDAVNAHLESMGAKKVPQDKVAKLSDINNLRKAVQTVEDRKSNTPS